MERDNTSVMSKVTATLGRNFIRSKEFYEAQMIGMDPVCIFCLYVNKIRNILTLSLLNIKAGKLLKNKTSIYSS